MERKFITKKSIIFIIVLLTLALGLIFLMPEILGEKVEIWVDGELYDTFALSDSFSLSLDNGVVITGDGETAYFEKSDCPDKVCIKAGKLSLSGEWAACLPNKTVLKITGRNGEADTVN
ncbi:MAG: NusG domain II-containing protein [Clostridia bacterium]|nr:NusG domain II-containing protein [Clostridia bacterium]